MKSFSLSSAQERIWGVCIGTVLFLGILLLLAALGNDLLSFLICLLACLLVAAGLAFYIANLFRAACILCPDEKKLIVRSFPDYTVDLSQAVSLQTTSYKNGPMASRTLLFLDARGDVVANIPTFFTANQGAQAEPMAMELASALNIAFISSLEAWEYDKAAQKEHQKQLSQEEKAARREKFRTLKAKILRMAGAGEPTPAISEEETSIEDDLEEYVSNGINYDALDEQK